MIFLVSSIFEDKIPALLQTIFNEPNKALVSSKLSKEENIYTRFKNKVTNINKISVNKWVSFEKKKEKNNKSYKF